MTKHLAHNRRSIEKNRHKKAMGLLGAEIVWKHVPRKGRGVFTTKRIRKGALIEAAPVVPISKKSVPDGDPPDGYVIEWNKKKKGEEYAMVLGYVMLYNHSSKPNIELESVIGGKVVNVKALRTIEAGEELMWDYNCVIWFDEKS